MMISIFKSLQSNKISDWSKLKAVADDNLKVGKMMIYFLDRVENIVGKGENAVYQHFLHYPRFQNSSCSRSLKSELFGKELIGHTTLWEKEKKFVTIFSFPSMFSKAFFFKVVRSWDCIEKG